MGMHTAEELYDTIDLTEDQYEVKVEEEIKQNANKEEIDIEPPTQEEQEEAQQQENKQPEQKKRNTAEQSTLFEEEPPF